MANVFNISPRYPFLEVLASYVIETAKRDNLNIANDLILLPTRRSCRHLKEVFLNLSGNMATLLPTILPLGDIDENGLAFLDYENEKLDDGLPPSISAIERNLILSYIIKKHTPSMPNISEEQAYSLAVDLAHLMDTVEMEELSFTNLKDIVPEEYSEHWQETLNFLKVITEEYPKLLKSINLLNPIDRKIKLIKKQVEFWKKYPPRGRVFAGGSTGSLVPIAYMLRFIANMDNGYLILPGLDKNISDADFKLLTSDYPTTNQNHPQYGLLKLIKSLGLKISDVPELPMFKKYDVADSARELLSSHIMLSSDMNDSWQNLPELDENILDDVSELTLKDEAEEVFAIASLLRKTVDENKRALLITPDRKIAKSVASELKRWNIIVDDSAGTPASDTTTGNYIILILKMIYDNFSPYSLLAVLKHKYTHLGFDSDTLKRAVFELENNVLRGKNGIDTLEKMLNISTDSPLANDLLLKVQSLTNEYSYLMGDTQKYSMYDLFVRHLKLVENFVLSDDVNINEILWNSDLHSSLSTELKNLLSSLKDISEQDTEIDKMTAPAYFIFISNYLLSLSLRPTKSAHPNIAIMNSIEARLMSADLYIMAGLNEDTFPSITSDDPWMSRPMKAKFKLPLPERKIGLSSHDFVEFFCKKNVVMTHAVKVNGLNTITSRWLTKLDAIATLRGIKRKNTLGNMVKSWLASFENETIGVRCERPRPCPPVYARPKKLSATWIEKWYRDPYIIFANKILRLKKLDDINPEVGPAEFGTIIHNSLEEFKKRNMSTFAELVGLMFNNAVQYQDIPQIDFWYSKFREVAKWFVDYEASIKQSISISYQEEEGALSLTDDFTITAKADRIDITKDNRAYIYDYKTGTPPSITEVENGYAPQLPIEALILKNNGFANIKTNAKVVGVRYIKLTGSDNGKITEVCDSIDEVVDKAMDNLLKTINAFSLEATPYLSRPNPNKVGHAIENYSEYEHLARVSEWNE